MKFSILLFVALMGGFCLASSQEQIDEIIDLYTDTDADVDADAQHAEIRMVTGIISVKELRKANRRKATIFGVDIVGYNMRELLREKRVSMDSTRSDSAHSTMASNGHGSTEDEITSESSWSACQGMYEE